jgi:sigma-B regulation protein RsbU (phosphoserine phosphatase)
VSWANWNKGNRFLRAMPLRSQLLFFAGTFFVFLPTGLLTDVSGLGATPPVRLIGSSIIAGGTAVLYSFVARYGAHWMAVLALFHVFGMAALNRWLGPLGPTLAGDVLQQRLGLDVGFTVLSLVAGFTLLSTFVRVEAARYGRLRAEVDLAREIHRVLVPALATRVGRVEVRGVSAPSGDVGGDLVDVVEHDGRWTAYVVDVSGHGVASGLLMGMVKSAARVALGGGATLAPLLTLLNRVIVELKSPTMFATFAGLQAKGDHELELTVAGHLPILRRRAGASTVEELTMAQLPIAMFEDTTYEAMPLAVTAGDLFVILTDGLTEVVNAKDDELGLERLKALVAAHGDEPLASIERRILETARAHGPQIDDQSLLLVRIA